MFKFFQENKEKFEVIIITGSLSIYVKWILEYNNLTQVFKEVYAHKAEYDKNGVLKIQKMHTHNCERCIKFQCKGLILKEHLDKNQDSISQIAYIGDGDNDICPALMLNSQDILFPRETWSLHKILEKTNLKDKIKCKIVYWKEGTKIKDELLSNLSELRIKF